MGDVVENELIIRKATELDIDKMEQFYYEVNDYLEKTNNYPAWEKDVYPARADAERAVNNDALVVATIGNNIVGSAIVNNEYPVQYNQVKWQVECNDNEIFIIHTFAVSPNYAQKGIGEKLINWIEDYAKKTGVKTIRLDCYIGNPPALRLYEKCGFTYLDRISIGLEDIGLDWFKIYEKLIK